MKKITSIIAVLAIIVSAASCTNGSNTPVTSVPETSASAETTAASSAEMTAGIDAPAKPGIKSDGAKYEIYASMTPEEITASLTIGQKSAQMVMPAIYNVTVDDMKANDYGSILSTAGCIGAEAWAATVDGFQKAAIESGSGIPFIYGQDDVHGVNYCRDAVYFPHNIGQGAANDEELAYQVGLITAD